MVEILIQGDNATAAAQALQAAFRDIFDVEPLISTRGGGARPGTRSLEALLLAVAIPSAIVHGKDVIHLMDLPGRWNRLISRADTMQSQDKSTTLMLDTGDGKPIPLHAANREQIMQALKALESQLKS